ncbi:MAG: hypothetical protein HUU35_11335, partial [Armatimonadetes bacterium]|nr:hypothetical protein [Armatimonadota bacterium]
MVKPDQERLLRHWRVLCEDIGERRAGTAGEDAAVAYLAEQFAGLGLAAVTREAFTCTAVEHSEAWLRLGELEVPARVLA